MEAVPIVVASTKGGVGKSTTVRALADAFAEQDLSVTVFDADPQQSVTWAVGANFGVDPWADHELIAVNAGTHHEWKLRRGGTRLKEASEDALISCFEQVAATPGTDVLLVDTGAFEPRIVRAAIRMVSARGRGMIISPIRANTDDIPGFVGARSLVQATDPHTLHRGLLCDVERLYAETRLVRESLRAEFPDEFFDLEIPHDARAKDATSWGRTSALTNDRRQSSRAASAYRQLASILRDEHRIAPLRRPM